MKEDTFRAESDRALVLLESLDLDQYYGELSLLDEAIASFGISCTGATPEQRAAFSDSLTRKGRKALGRYVLRAPMLALRGRDGSMLRTGLLIYALLEQRVHDWRDDLIAFAPYFCVAQELGLAPLALFDDAASYAVPSLGTVMQSFGRRRDITLEAFGWRRIETPDGPTLEMLNWRVQPSGAIVGSPAWDSVHGALARDLLNWVETQSKRTRPN